MATEKIFPFEFEARKPILFYPEPVEQVVGDVLEIGPGRGDLFFWLAANYPHKQFVAIEIGHKRYRKLCERTERRGLRNVSLLRGNARVIVPKYFTAPTFERIYVLFPDPWPKPRHSFYRLLSCEFLIQLADVLTPHGDIILATDWQPYADWVIENLAQVDSLRNTGSPYAADSNLIPSGEPTWFENKWREEGRSIFYVHMERTHD